MSYTDNLDTYHSFPETTSCYLDGRYFNRVLRFYPGLISEPLNIYIFRRADGRGEYNVSMRDADLDNSFPGLLRVIIHTPEGRHSNLLILDYQRGVAFRYEPYGSTYPHFNLVNELITEYLFRYGNFHVVAIEEPAHLRKNPVCENRGGLCMMYVIKFAYDYVNGRQYDQSNILRFASMVEQLYGPLPELGKDVEYGLFGNDNPNQGRNAAIGLVGGAALGGIVAGPTGLLLGGIGGGLLGSAM